MSGRRARKRVIFRKNVLEKIDFLKKKPLFESYPSIVSCQTLEKFSELRLRFINISCDSTAKLIMQK